PQKATGEEESTGDTEYGASMALPGRLCVWCRAGLLPGQRLHPGARHGLLHCCLADRLLRQVHGHRAVEDVKGQALLATHDRADRPLQYGNLLGAIQATNLEGHAVHRVCSMASLIIPRPSVSFINSL